MWLNETKKDKKDRNEWKNEEKETNVIEWNNER